MEGSSNSNFQQPGTSNQQHCSEASDLSKFPISWQHVESPYPGRDGHCAASVGHKLYIFGGVVQTQADDHHESNELITFEPESMTWNTVATSGDIPAPRSSATMAAVGDKLYVFGGLSHSVGWLADVYLFDTVTGRWSKLQTSGPMPSPRDKLASAVTDQRIFIFGGFGPKIKPVNEDGSDDEDEDDEDSDEETNDLEETQEAAKFGWCDDLYVFDTVSKTWSQPMHKNVGCGPSPRAAHTMCAVGRELIVFGGRDAESRQNDLFIYNIDTQKWMKDCLAASSSSPPQPRSFHAACTIGSEVVVVGGRLRTDAHSSDVHIFDAVERRWMPSMYGYSTTSGDTLTPRGVHTATVVGHHLVIYGGSDAFDKEIQQCTVYHSDAYIADCGTLLNNQCTVPQSSSSSSTMTGDESGIPSKRTKTDDGCTLPQSND